MLTIGASTIGSIFPLRGRFENRFLVGIENFVKLSGWVPLVWSVDHFLRMHRYWISKLRRSLPCLLNDEPPSSLWDADLPSLNTWVHQFCDTVMGPLHQIQTCVAGIAVSSSRLGAVRSATAQECALPWSITRIRRFSEFME